MPIKKPPADSDDDESSEEETAPAKKPVWGGKKMTVDESSDDEASVRGSNRNLKRSKSMKSVKSVSFILPTDETPRESRLSNARYGETTWRNYLLNFSNLALMIVIILYMFISYKMTDM